MIDNNQEGSFVAKIIPSRLMKRFSNNLFLYAIAFSLNSANRGEYMANQYATISIAKMTIEITCI